MKIAHIVCTFPPYKGGMGNSTHSFAKILAEKGHDVTVFTPDYEGIKDEKGGFKIVRLKPLFKYGNAAILPQVLWQLKGFDIVHLHYPFYGTAGLLLLKKILNKKMKLVVHYHMDTMASGLKGLIFKLNEKFVLPQIIKKADAVTCASLDYVENSDVKELFKKYRNKFFETNFGVDLEKFKPSGKIAKKNILFVGGLDTAHYFKGVENLLKAFKIVSSEFPDCALSIVGDGDRREYYMKMAEDLGVSEKVSFDEKVDRERLVSFFQDCAFLVLPSINKSEAYGLVLLEALATGKPIIASNLPGVRSVFEKGKQGLLAEPGNIGDLAERMRELLVDDKLREDMGREARILAEEKYSWGKVGERLEEVYKRV